MRVQIKEVTKKIKGRMILNQVDLELNSGKIYGLQGPNGSGKTMMLRLISGLILPTQGEVWIDEQRLGKDIVFPDSIGALIENPAFQPYYTGYKNLELLAELNHRIGKEEIRRTLEDVELDPDDTRKFYKYSLGMKQRLGIAAAIMESPQILLLDEPTNALDEQGVLVITELIKRQKELGSLIVIASHDALFLEMIADEIFEVRNGKVERRL